ncbi:MAG: SDR family oxidoreductase [Steroidobacteraceae bacterium]
MNNFANRTVLITGASEGIGRALALELADQGARLALNARSAARLGETARDCAGRGAEVVAVAGDVARLPDCQRLIEATLARFGGLDVVVNNAGITMWSRFDALQDLSVFGRLLAVNYLGAVYVTAAALPHLRRSRGLLVAVASIAGLTGVPERTGYAASKHAMIGFFESLRIELLGSGVDVSIIAPDFVVSQIHRRAIGPDGKPLGATPMQESRIMSAQRCAQLMVRAMQRRRRFTILSPRGRLVRWARLIVPRAVDRIAPRAIR